MYKNTVYSLGAKTVAGVCFFLLDILIVRLLGYDNYNEWSFYFSIATIIKYLDRMGVDTSSKVHIARAVNNKKEQDQYFKAGFGLEILCSAGVFLVELVCAYPLCRILGYPEKYPHLFPLFLAGIVFTSAYSVICFFKDASVGLLSYGNLFRLTVIEFCGYLAFAYFGMKIGGLIGLGAGHSVTIIISAIYGLFLYRDKICVTQNREDILCKMKIMFQYALPLIFVNMGGLVLTEMDTFMLGIFSHNQVGIYAVPKNLLGKAINIPGAICLGMIPSYAVFNKNNYHQKKKGYFKLIGLYCAVLTFIAVMFGVFGKKVTFILYGESYSDSILVLYWLIPYFVLYSLTTFLSSFLSYQKRERELMVSHSVMIISNIVFNIALIPRYGAVGAAAATDISLVIFFAILLGYHTKYIKRLQKVYGSEKR